MRLVLQLDIAIRKNVLVRRALCLLLPMLLFGAAGCGGDSTGPKAAAYEDIDGTYAGVVTGTSQGISANMLFGLTVGQKAGDFTGSLDGTIEIGQNPSLDFKIKTAACPDYEATFSGDYDSDTHRLTVRRPEEFFDDAQRAG